MTLAFPLSRTPATSPCRFTREQDTIKIEASETRYPAEEAITAAIHLKYSNRILHDVGLCIALHDLLTCGVGKVRWGDGCLYYTTVFRLVVFRPVPGEVLLGKIVGATPEGVKLSLGFFDDIFLPSHLLPTPSTYDYAEKTWFWVQNVEEGDVEFDDPLAAPKENRAYLDVDEVIRFRVEAESFQDPEPGPQKVGEKTEEELAEIARLKKAPYTITVSAQMGPATRPLRWSAHSRPPNPHTGWHIIIGPRAAIVVDKRRRSRLRRGRGDERVETAIRHCSIGKQQHDRVSSMKSRSVELYLQWEGLAFRSSARSTPPRRPAGHAAEHLHR